MVNVDVKRVNVAVQMVNVDVKRVNVAVQVVNVAVRAEPSGLARTMPIQNGRTFPPRFPRNVRSSGRPYARGPGARAPSAAPTPQPPHTGGKTASVSSLPIASSSRRIRSPAATTDRSRTWPKPLAPLAPGAALSCNRAKATISFRTSCGSASSARFNRHVPSAINERSVPYTSTIRIIVLSLYSSIPPSNASSSDTRMPAPSAMPASVPSITAHAFVSLKADTRYESRAG